MGRTRGTFTPEEKAQLSARLAERCLQKKQPAGAKEVRHEDSPQPPAGASLESRINSYLVLYNARLLEIDHKYPLGDPARPEWLTVHRKTGVKSLTDIFLGKHPK